MKKMFTWFANPPVTGSSSILLIRGVTGIVFCWEGMIKFLFVNQGTGRFARLGFPFPEITAHIIATGEILGGFFLIAGLFTRITAFYFLNQMIIAVITTKIDLYLGRSPLPRPPAPPQSGIWAVLHESRSDIAQIAGCFFLILEGAGRWSVDFILSTRRKPIFKIVQSPLKSQK